MLSLCFKFYPSAVKFPRKQFFPYKFQMNICVYKASVQVILKLFCSRLRHVYFAALVKKILQLGRNLRTANEIYTKKGYQEAQPSRDTKRMREKERIMTKQKPHMKLPTHKEGLQQRNRLGTVSRKLLGA